MLTKNNLPNFLIVGAPKCGTSSLFFYLKNHPEIFFPQIKEPYFLCYHKNFTQIKQLQNTKIIKTIDEYKKLFLCSASYKAVGEATPLNLYFYNYSINNIYKFFPNPFDTKIIIMLRSPTKRAFSHFMMHKRNGLVDYRATFLEEIKKSNSYPYVKVGMYYDQVKTYLKNFKRVKIIIFENFIKNTNAEIKDICDFLEINNDYEINTKKIYNISGNPRNKLINTLMFGNYKTKKILEKIIPNNFRKELVRIVSKHNTLKTSVDAKTKKFLHKQYSDEINKLEILLNTNLSVWKNK